jgi:prophage tail gpP-like protein
VALQNASKQKISQAAGSNILQAYGMREMARANIKELQVQIQMAGHFNDQCVPFMPDQVYRIRYDVDGIDEDMYLYEVEYFLDEQGSQRTRLFFCRQTAIVANSKVFSAK